LTGCPSCGAATTCLYATDRNRRTTSTTFEYKRCTVCGAVSIVEPPADLSAFYPDDYHQISPGPRAMERAADHEHYKLDLIQKFLPSGRLLEIGPGGGAFAWSCSRAGFSVEALEFSPAAAAALRRTLEVPVHVGEASPSSVESLGPYDVIAMWHVLEHCREPAVLLRALSERIRPGGIIVVATPNPESLQFRLLGRYWPHLDAPRHLWLVPIPTIELWARDAALETIDVTLTDPGGLGWNEFGWAEFLVSWLPGNWRSDPMHLATRLARRLGRLVTSLISGVERSGRRGATYTVTFRRSPRATDASDTVEAD
jgi:2-polyprenyl-3-methyl-5-hydroxy-6-metoxy-1,4-benzoquinol methylase